MGRQDRGSIYVEVIIAVALLSILIAPLLSVYSLNAVTNWQAGKHTVAASLAQAAIEQLMTENWATINTRTLPADPKYPGFQVTITLLAQRLPNLKDLQITVTWPDRGGVTRQFQVWTSIAQRQ